ncbi:hypothetical protein G6L08_08425 [Agrobacterium rhizogenes]|nr:hypothetical protein [Rhizobium rhizogenes]
MPIDNQERTELFDLLRDQEALEQYGLEMVRRDYPGANAAELSEQVMVRHFHDWMTRSLHLVDYVDSPMEQAFMGSMIIRAMTTKAFAVEFRSTTEDIEDDIKRVEYLIQLRWDLSRGHELEVESILEDANHMSAPDRAEFIREFAYFDDFEAYLDKLVSEGELSTKDRRDAFDRFPFFVFDHHVFCFVQPIIHFGGISYRPDFLMWMPSVPNVKVVVECDGRDYHIEPEVFAADRIRDRKLALNDYYVLRYSGSEIFGDPSEATADLHLHLLKKLAVRR